MGEEGASGSHIQGSLGTRGLRDCGTLPAPLLVPAACSCHELGVCVSSWPCLWLPECPGEGPGNPTPPGMCVLGEQSLSKPLPELNGEGWMDVGILSAIGGDPGCALLVCSDLQCIDGSTGAPLGS